MSLSRQARIEVEPSRVGYPSWWVVPISYETIPTLVACVDVFWIVALSVMTSALYQWISYSIDAAPAFDPSQPIGVGIAVAVMFSTA
jgi:hypothetical protein